MAGDFGEVHVMDWGLAKVLDEGGVADEMRAKRGRDEASAIRTFRTGSNAGESLAGSVLGTPAYMAPEQARGEIDTVDERADVFGLGSILCEILSGQPAYAGGTGLELYRMAERADVQKAFDRLDACGTDAELILLAKSCLKAAQKDRPRDAGAVLAALNAYLAGAERRLREAGLAKARAETLAAEERKRRTLSVALAASVLVTGLDRPGRWAWLYEGPFASSTVRTEVRRSRSAVTRVQARGLAAIDLGGMEVIGQADIGMLPPDRNFDPAALTSKAERMIALDTRLPAFLRGEGRPIDAKESAEFAQLCFSKKLYADSARLWSEAFSARPALADEHGSENYYQAARRGNGQLREWQRRT